MLFTTLVFKDKNFTENIIYEKLLSEKLSVNLGYVYENVVAQILCVHKSLDAFSNKYSDRILDKYLVYTKDLKKDADILMMPIYIVPFLK